MTLHDLSPEQLSKFQIMYKKEEKQLLIGYLLLIFVGPLGAHELYTKDINWFKMRWAFYVTLGVGIVLMMLFAALPSMIPGVLVSIITFIGIVGSVVVNVKTLVDYFLMPKKVKEVNQQIEDEIIVEIKGQMADDFMTSGKVKAEPAEAEKVEVVTQVQNPPEIVNDPIPVQPEVYEEKIPEPTVTFNPQEAATIDEMPSFTMTPETSKPEEPQTPPVFDMGQVPEVAQPVSPTSSEAFYNPVEQTQEIPQAPVFNTEPQMPEAPLPEVQPAETLVAENSFEPMPPLPPTPMEPSDPEQPQGPTMV